VSERLGGREPARPSPSKAPGPVTAERRSLPESGCATQNPLRLGLQTGARAEVLGRTGVATSGLFYVGPLLRATHWEAPAVAELRGRAERLAEHLARPPQGRQ